MVIAVVVALCVVRRMLAICSDREVEGMEVDEARCREGFVFFFFLLAS